MNPDQENFDSLRRLLAVKRHEQPPPGYFQDFSSQVLLRIRAGERVDRSSFWESLSWEAPWLARIWGVFEAKPILAGALGAAVCGLLVSAIVISEKAVNPAGTNFAATQNEAPSAEVAFQAGANPLGSATAISPEQSAVIFDGVKIPSATATLVGWPVGNGN